MIRFVTINNCSPSEKRKSVLLTKHELNSFLSRKPEILQFLQNPSKKFCFEFVLKETEKGVTKLVGSLFNDQGYISIRYYYTTLSGDATATRFGISLNMKECVQLFSELPAIISYISYLTPYVEISQPLFQSIFSQFYSLATDNFKTYNSQYSDKKKSFVDITAYITTYFSEISSKLDVQSVCDTFLSNCDLYGCTPLKRSDLVSLIPLMLENEKRNLISATSNDFTFQLLGDVLGPTPSERRHQYEESNKHE